MADADGENAQSALSSPEPIISPAWSPSGGQIAYVSFESRKPVVYVHDVATGRRRLIAGYLAPTVLLPGLQMAALWRSPSAVTAARSSTPLTPMEESHVVLCKVLALTRGAGVFERWSHDLLRERSWAGAPQIYRVPVGGGSAERVTFSGNYNISPSISPDGKCGLPSSLGWAGPCKPRHGSRFRRSQCHYRHDSG